MLNNNDNSELENINDILDEYGKIVDENKRDIKTTTERRLCSQVKKILQILKKDSLEYKRWLMIKEKANKYEKEAKENDEKGLVREAELLIKEYEAYEKENKKYPPKDSDLYKKSQSIIKIRKEKRSKELDYHIERLKEMNKYDNPGVDEKLERLQEFYENERRLPNQNGGDKNECQLGNFVSQFPRYKYINRLSKEKYIDIINRFIDDTLEKAMNYKSENNQEHLKVSPNDKLHANIVSVGKLLSKARKPNDTKPIFYKECETERQLKIYEELNIRKQNNYSDEDRKNIIDAKFKRLIEFINEKQMIPTESNCFTKEEREILNIYRGYTNKNKRLHFLEEQINEIKQLEKKYGGKRGGGSFPESLYAISLEELFKEKYSKIDRHKIVDDVVNVDMFLEIDGKEYVFFYDGKYYHADKVIDDKEKTEKLIKNNKIVIRVREYGLDNLELENKNLIIHPLTKTITAKKDYIENINMVANEISKGNYKDKLEEKWDKIRRRAWLENIKYFTELKHIIEFLKATYQNKSIPISTGEGKNIYRNMNRKTNDYSLFALMVFYLASICFPAGKREAWKKRIINEGLNENTLEELETFLSSGIE